MSVTVAVQARRRLALHQTKFLKINICSSRKSDRLAQHFYDCQANCFYVSCSVTIKHLYFCLLTWCDSLIFSGPYSRLSRVELLTPSQWPEVLRLEGRQLAVDWQLYSTPWPRSQPPSSARPDKLNFRLDLHKSK